MADLLPCRATPNANSPPENFRSCFLQGGGDITPIIIACKVSPLYSESLPASRTIQNLSYISVAGKCRKIYSLMPSLLVKTFRIHVAAWSTQRPQETFFSLRTVLLACRYLTMVSFLEIPNPFEFRVLTGTTNSC